MSCCSCSAPFFSCPRPAVPSLFLATRCFLHPVQCARQVQPLSRRPLRVDSFSMPRYFLLVGKRIRRQPLPEPQSISLTASQSSTKLFSSRVVSPTSETKP